MLQYVTLLIHVRLCAFQEINKINNQIVLLIKSLFCNYKYYLPSISILDAVLVLAEPLNNY